LCSSNDTPDARSLSKAGSASALNRANAFVPRALAALVQLAANRSSHDAKPGTALALKYSGLSGRTSDLSPYEITPGPGTGVE